MKSRRLFFALEPPAEVRDAIERVKQGFAELNQGRAVPEENLHLTLQFLGGMEDSALEGLTEVAQSLQTAPFSLQLDNFGHWERPRALWMGPQITPVPLLALQAGLETALKRQCGVELESRPYRPHVTLMRKVKEVEGLPHVAPILWEVEHFSLMESVSTDQGVEYHPLGRWNLTK